MAGDAAAFYHDPPLWVGAAPRNLIDPSQADFDSFRDEVYRRQVAGGLEVKATRQGLFGFSFAGWELGELPPLGSYGAPEFDAQVDAVLNRTLVMNSFLAFLYSNMVTIGQYELDRMVVTPELVIPMQAGLDGDAMSFGNQRVSHLAMSSYVGTYLPDLPVLVDDRLIMRSVVISPEVLEATQADFSSLMSSGYPDGLLLVDLFLRSNKSYQDHNYSASLITTWAIAERLMNELRDPQSWRTPTAGAKLSKSPAAAVVSKALLDAGRISPELHEKIDRVREVRNGWIHSLATISAEDAQVSTAVCEQLFKIVRGVTVKGKYSRRIHG